MAEVDPGPGKKETPAFEIRRVFLPAYIAVQGCGVRCVRAGTAELHRERVGSSFHEANCVGTARAYAFY